MRNETKAARAIRLVNQLTHTKGPFAGQSFDLRPWQRKILTQLFKTRKDGLRQYRTCLLMLPRKNGKSELCAALAIYFLLFDGEIGAEVYSAAADKDQAALVFNVAAQMIRVEPELLAQCEIVDSQKRIVHRRSGSVYRAISAEAYSKHGFNASAVIYDELHAAPNRELWDVLSTSQGARAQPIMMAITTAGYDRRSVLYELYSHAKRVQENPSLDPTFLPILFEAPKEADWTDEQVWKQANPALGDFRSFEEMRVMFARAQQIPAQENAFRRLYLNQWTEQADRWMPLEAWDACCCAPPEPLDGRECFVGMDLSQTRDLTALVAVFPGRSDGGFDVVCKAFIPEDNIRERVERDRVPYDQWVKSGHVIVTPGNVVDYQAVRRVLLEWHRAYSIQAIGYDPQYATQLVTELSNEDGISVDRVPQNGPRMLEATGALEKAILGSELHHDGNPVLRWAMGNAAVKIGLDGHGRLSKASATERMDPVIALAMALEQKNKIGSGGISTYESRGLTTV